jgi:hypothetical protein
MKILTQKVTLAQEYLGFLLLNLTDLFMTGFILAHQGQEANKTANWVLSNFGQSGFVVYKFLLTTVVVLACEGIATKNIRKAKAVVLFGCLILTFVVCYESFLIITNIHMKPRAAAFISRPTRLPRGNEAGGAHIPERVRNMLRGLPENRGIDTPPTPNTGAKPPPSQWPPSGGLGASGVPQNPEIKHDAHRQPGKEPR